MCVCVCVCVCGYSSFKGRGLGIEKEVEGNQASVLLPAFECCIIDGVQYKGPFYCTCTMYCIVIMCVYLFPERRRASCSDEETVTISPHECSVEVS